MTISTIPTLVLFALGSAAPQTPAPSPVACTPIAASVEQPAPPAAHAKPSDVMPGSFARGLRGLQVAYEITDNNDFIVAKIPDADGELIEDLVRNPDQRLWKTTFTFRPGEWLTSPKDVADAYSSLAEFRSVHVTRLQSPQTWSQLQALAEGDAWGVGSQLLNSVTASVSWSRRPTAANIDPAFVDLDDTIRTWGFKFDPATLFQSASARKSGYQALKSYLDAFGADDARELQDTRCKGDSLGRCADELLSASGAGWARALGVILPAFEVRSLDEFDFRQVGGRFILPLPSQKEATLENYSFTWDLKRIVSGFASERAAALSAAKIHMDVAKLKTDLRAPAPVVEPQQLPPPVAGQSYVARLVAKGTGNLKWEMVTPNGFPGVTLHSDGWLTGMAQGCSGGRCQFDIKVTDPRDRSTVCRIQLP